MLISLDYIQVVDDPLRIAVSKKNLPVEQLDSNSAVPPNVGLAIAYATNSNSAQRIPALNLVAFDLQKRNRLEAETQSSNLHSVTAEVVMKSVPDHGERGNHEAGDKAHGEPRSRVWNRQRRRLQDDHRREKKYAPSLARMNLFRQHLRGRQGTAALLPEGKSRNCKRATNANNR